MKIFEKKSGGPVVMFADAAWGLQAGRRIWAREVGSNLKKRRRGGLLGWLLERIRGGMQ
jgi:hypothetical protein